MVPRYRDDTVRISTLWKHYRQTLLDGFLLPRLCQVPNWSSRTCILPYVIYLFHNLAYIGETSEEGPKFEIRALATEAAELATLGTTSTSRNGPRPLRALGRRGPGRRSLGLRVSTSPHTTGVLNPQVPSRCLIRPKECAKDAFLNFLNFRGAGISTRGPSWHSFGRATWS